MNRVFGSTCTKICINFVAIYRFIWFLHKTRSPFYDARSASTRNISNLSRYCTRKVGSGLNKRHVLLGFLVLTITRWGKWTSSVNHTTVVEKMPIEITFLAYIWYLHNRSASVELKNDNGSKNQKYWLTSFLHGTIQLFSFQFAMMIFKAWVTLCGFTGNLFIVRCTKCHQIVPNTDSPICEALRDKGSELIWFPASVYQ